MAVANRGWRLFLKLLFYKTCRIQILHRERSEPRGGWILAANHISHFDPPLLSIAARRPLDWMAMEELFSHPVFGYLLKSVGAFPVRRGKPDRKALRIAVERLKDGRVVGIFPEGGIRDGCASVLEGGEIRAGISLIAAMASVPVVPTVILGSDRLYNKTRWKKFRKTPIWVGFGETIVSPVEASTTEREDFERSLQEALRRLRTEMEHHFGLTEDDLPKAPARRMAE